MGDWLERDVKCVIPSAAVLHSTLFCCTPNLTPNMFGYNFNTKGFHFFTNVLFFDYLCIIINLAMFLKLLQKSDIYTCRRNQPLTNKCSLTFFFNWYLRILTNPKTVELLLKSLNHIEKSISGLQLNFKTH